jgi:hypothetical protein
VKEGEVLTRRISSKRKFKKSFLKRSGGPTNQREMPTMIEKKRNLRTFLKNTTTKWTRKRFCFFFVVFFVIIIHILKLFDTK